MSIAPNPAGASGDQPQINYHYDANGNLSQKIITQTISGHHTSNTLDYTFDVRGQLQQITTGGSTIGQFLYDANGQRIRARFSNNDGALLSDRYSLYQGLNLLSQYDISTSNTPLLNANYLINPQTSNPIGRTAWREKDSTNNTLAWYHTDALGSVLAIAKTNSSITARYDYDAWGNETHNTGTSDNPLGYTGHQMDRLSDDKTGLIYANARYLDPDTGRFLSFDPFEGYDNKPISLHRYLYAYQNPARYVDKDGRCAEPITLTLCVAAAAALAGSTYDYFMTDRREQAYAEVQPASLVGSVLTEGYAFGQSAANTLTGGYFDAARTETVVQHTMENVLPVDAAQRAYGEFTRKDGDLIQGALYTAKALGQTAGLGLAFAGAKSPTIAKPKSGVVVESPREVGSVVPDNSVFRETGARRVLDPVSLDAWDAVEGKYDLIRANATDVGKIAENIGWSESRVARIKDHVFFKEHQLDSGLQRFDADPDMFNAWNRLETGDFVKSDIDLLRHEIFESKFEGIFKTNYRTAHDRTIDSGRTWTPE